MWGGAVGVVTGAVVSGFKSAEYIEPYWYASHWYVRNHATETLKPVKSSMDIILGKVGDVQYDAAKDKRERAVNDVAKWQLELGKPENSNNETARNLINERLRNLTDTRENLDRQIRAIERAKAQEH